MSTGGTQVLNRTVRIPLVHWLIIAESTSIAKRMKLKEMSIGGAHVLNRTVRTSVRGGFRGGAKGAAAPPYFLAIVIVYLNISKIFTCKLLDKTITSLD